MLPTLPNRALALLVFIFLSNPASADAYSDARAELISAYQLQDFTAMQGAAHKALLARPGYPGALFNLAFAKALAGDNQESLQILSALVKSGVDFAVADAEEFAALQSLPEWPAFAADVAALQESVGKASVAFTHDAGEFVPEGIIAIGDEVLLGSIRNGSIIRIGKDSEVLSEAESAGHWSVFGMRRGPDGGIWFASAAVPEYAAISDATQGSTGLFRLNLETKEVDVRTVLPKQDQAMVLGDLEFIDDDTIYATESLTGALYRYVISKAEMTQVVAPGKLRSMQGLVLDAGGDHLYVSDYVGGLFRVRLSDHAIERVTAGPTVSLFGIDGLYRQGDELIAIQNGIRPNRVAAFTLGADGTSITHSRVLARNLPEFDEPTLGAVVGDEFLFVANSHWNRFDREGNLATDLAGPIILRIKL
jgi:sugar lactone lactonase YvrE